MAGFIFFILSFLMVIFSSYSIVRLIKPEKFVNFVLYLVLVLISQVILSVEYLSIVKLVSPGGFLLVNISVLAISMLFWKYGKSFDFKQVDIKNSLKKLFQCIKQDKILLILFVLFVYSSLISLFLAFFCPSIDGDSMIYHLPRIGYWIQHQTLAHYETIDIRQLILSINSEILILWSMLFFKRDFLAIMPQYLSYLGIIFLVYAYLDYLKISKKRIMWSILILASFPEFIVEASSTQTNLIVGFLLFCSFYLYFYGVKEKDNKSIVFSAIAYSIDLGVKNTVFFFVPVFGIIYLIISIKERKKEFYKPVLLFVSSSIPAFIIFSSYNYILNYIDFGNFLGARAYLDEFKYTFSLKGLIANIIRYFLLMIDFSGIKNAAGLNQYYIGLKSFLFSILHLKPDDGLAFFDITALNTIIDNNCSKFGILGFVLFIPLILKSSFSGLFSKKNKMFYICITGLLSIGFIISISALMGFCYFNNRYLISAFILSAPVLALCYSRKTTFFKIFICVIVALNLIFIPVSIRSEKIVYIIKYYLENNFNYVLARNNLRLVGSGPEYSYIINNLLLNAPDNSRIALILNNYDNEYPFFEENPSWKIYPVRYEMLYKKKNYKDYDFIVFANIYQDEDIITNNYNGQTKPKIVYEDKNIEPTTVRPFFQRNTIDFSYIKRDFKMLGNEREMVLVEGNHKKVAARYCIYKKKLWHK